MFMLFKRIRVFMAYFFLRTWRLIMSMMPMRFNRTSVEPQDEKKAQELLFSRANSDNAEAQYNLARKFHTGSGIPVNEAEAIKWYRKAAYKGYKEAQYNLGLLLMSMGHKNVLEARHWMQEAARQGMAAAQLYFGEHFAFPNSGDLQWHRKAAAQGLVEAQYKLGMALLNKFFQSPLTNPLTEERDQKESMEWFRKAAIQGHPDAQYELGRGLADGIGLQKNTKEAAGWFKAAGIQGSVSALKALAHLLENGDGVPKDIAESSELNRKAESHYRLDLDSGLKYYRHGKALKDKDIKEAIKYFQRSDCIGAKLQLGYCYLYGNGVQKDLKRALLLFNGNCPFEDEEQVDAFNKVNHEIILQVKEILGPENEELEDSEHWIENVEKQLNSTEDEKVKLDLLKTLAFCHQMGFNMRFAGGKKLACKYYEQAIKMGADCHWDLYSCYDSLYNEGGNITLDTFRQFYKELEIESENKNGQEKAVLYAYLLEKSAPGLSQDLSKAFRYYQKASTLDPSMQYAAEKVKFYSVIFKFTDVICNACPELPISINIKAIAGIVAEYSFESEPSCIKSKRRN